MHMPTQTPQFGRKDALMEEFSQFQSQLVSEADLHKFLKQKCGSSYDAALFGQLTQLATNGAFIDLQVFVDAYVETEDTLQFRIEMLAARIHELKMDRSELQKRIEQEQGHQQYLEQLIWRLVDRTLKLEPTLCKTYSSISSVKCGNEAYHTKEVIGTNPQWSESFDFVVQDRQQSSNLAIEVYDVNRVGQEHYGSLTFSLNELKQMNVKDVNNNLVRNEIKLKTKLQAKIKYIQSKENTLQSDAKKITEQIQSLENENRENEIAIQALHRPFKTYSTAVTIRHSKQPRKPSVVINAAPSFLDVHEKEREWVMYLDHLTIVDDWTKVYLRTYCVFIAVCLLTSLNRNVLLDLTLTAILITLILQRQLTQSLFRGIFMGFVLQFIIDLVWLSIFTKNWTNYPGETPGQDHMKHFTIAMSFILMVLRIPFTVLTWKHSIQYEEFSDSLHQYHFLNSD